MAERRMFAKTIVTSDAFLDMPMSARCLYFTLGMFADDDGFVNNPKSIIRQIGASDDDIRVLLTKKFILSFETGVIVIKHWRINNYLRGDRHHETTYVEEMKRLAVDDNGAYTEVGIPSVNQLSTNCQPTVNQHRYTEASIGKASIVKNSIGESTEETPTLDDISAFVKEEDLDVDPERFFNYYEARGWAIKGDPVRDWKALIRSWAPKKEEAHSYEKAEQKLDQLREYRQSLIDSEASSEDIEKVEMEILSIEDVIRRAS